MNRHYYAAQSPRGFANEINIYRFGSKADRVAFVSDHFGAETITARDARRILARKDNDLTKQYNRLMDCEEIKEA
jgi:hypothetical protein